MPLTNRAMPLTNTYIVISQWKKRKIYALHLKLSVPEAEFGGAGHTPRDLGLLPELPESFKMQ